MADDTTLDFAEDGKDKLTLLDQLFGEQAQMSDQAQHGDAGAEVDDSQGPGASVIPPAPPQPSGLMPAFNPAVPSTPAAQGPQPDATPAAAPAPEPNGSLAMASPRPGDLNPNALTRASDKLANEGIKDKDKAYALQEKAATDLANAQAEQNTAAQPFKDQAAELYAQKAKAQDMVSNLATQVHQQYTAETQKDLEAQQNLANEKPQDFWGHRNTVQKISAVIGVIAAGVAGNSMGYVDSLINSDIAAYNRKRDALERIRGIHADAHKEDVANVRDQSQMIETQSIARMQWIESAMQAKINQSSNATVKANLQKALGELQVKKADDIAALNNQKMTRWATEEQHAIELQRMNMEKAQQQKAPEDTSVPFDMVEQTIPGNPRGIPKNLIVSVKKDVDQKMDALNTAQSLREQIAKFENGGTSLAQAISQSAPLRSYLLATARKFTGVGANLTGNEKSQMEDMALTLKDIAAGKITGANWEGKLQAIEMQLAQSVRQQVTSNTPGLRIKSDSAPGRVFARQEQLDARAEQEQQQVQAELQGKTPVKQNAALVMLADHGNKVAQNLLKKKEAEGFIGRTKQLLGIGQTSDE